jgi:hypothetical protein
LTGALLVDVAAAQPGGEELQELRRRVEELSRTVAVLQARVEAQEEALLRLQAGAAAPASQAPEPAAAVGQGPPGSPAAAPVRAAVPATAATYFNPAVSVIGNFLAAGGREAGDDLPSASLRESEFGFQAVVDPYARADFFLAFGEEGAEVEEGYVTFTKLPADLLVKAGRMRARFGKVNTLHAHTLPWPDEPLTVVNLLGGEEGWIDDGVSVARLIPLGEVFTEATLEVFRGAAEGLFEAPGRSDLSYNAHYRVFADLTEATNLDLGLSYGVGPNGATDSAQTSLAGLDLTFRWKPLRTALYRAATLRAEAVWSEREGEAGSERPWGWFVAGEYKLARRWSLGARLEAAQRAGDDRATDRGQALLATFAPSEFSLLRGEVRRRSFAGGEEATDFLLQLQFAIGAHGAHPF